MDEVVGRPGHVAPQFGHLDALQDAPTPSLCPHLPVHLPTFDPQLARHEFAHPKSLSSEVFLFPFFIGETNENVPRK